MTYAQARKGHVRLHIGLYMLHNKILWEVKTVTFKRKRDLNNINQIKTNRPVVETHHALNMMLLYIFNSEQENEYSWRE
jgi:hypothetical protein